MSTLVDSILNSDAFAATPSSARRQQDLPSSSRPRPIPSESNGQPSEADVYPDDEVVGNIPGRSRNPLDRNVEKVVDVAGEKVEQAFEDFLEAHVEEPSSSGLPPSSELKTDKYYINQIHGLREFQLSTLYVDYRHLLAYREGTTLADAIASQYYRFL
jgi:DNA replication licensing factor MCM6